VAQERDQLLANAESKKSSRKKEIFLADMSRQSKKERQSGVKSEAPDVAYNVVEGVQGHEQRRDQGVLAWDKQQVALIGYIWYSDTRESYIYLFSFDREETLTSSIKTG
jgi:hypothetical protein